MYLKRISLSGFKTFVDQSKITFSEGLNVIVGPNGCGKSNVVDAVRWVMGESTAKHLRGDSITDVIFAGTDKRSPASVASVELLFDNSDGRLSGEYSRYAEITIRRQVNRSGVSSYYLNGTLCRRKDIIDLFVLTGFGPRSYSIIEQGMVVDLVSAKPEEIRQYIEQVAGIAQYKSRRTETENRIQRTRDNLEKLGHIQHEIEQTLTRLEKQSKQAKQYQVLKEKEVELSIQLYWVQCFDLDKSIQEKQVALDEKSDQMDLSVSKKTKDENTLNVLKSELTHLSLKKDQQSEANYQKKSELIRLEEKILAQEEAEKVYQQNQQRLTTLLTTQKDRLLDIEVKLNTELSNKESLSTSLIESQAVYVSKREAYDSLALTMKSFSDELQEKRNEKNALSLSCDWLKSQLSDLSTTFDRKKNLLDEIQSSLETIELDMSKIDVDTMVFEKSVIEKAITELNQHQETDLLEKETITHSMQELKDEFSKVSREYNTSYSEFKASETMLNVLLGKEKSGQLSHWLKKHELLDHSRLIEQIKVASGWESLVQEFIDHFLFSLLSEQEDFNQSIQYLSDLNEGIFSVVELSNHVSEPIEKSPSLKDCTTLVDYVSYENHRFDFLFADVFVVESLDQALALRDGLQRHQRFVLKSGGYIVGRSFVTRISSAEKKQDVFEIQNKVTQLSVAVSDLELRKQSIMNQLEEKEKILADITNAIMSREGQINQERSKIRSFEDRISDAESLLLKLEIKQSQLNKETEEVTQWIDENELLSDEKSAELTDKEKSYELLSAEIDVLAEQNSVYQAECKALDQEKEVAQKKVQQLEVSKAESSVLCQSFSTQKNEMESQHTKAQEELLALQNSYTEIDLSEWKSMLSVALLDKQALEEELTNCQNAYNEHVEEVSIVETLLKHHNAEIEAVRKEIESLNLLQYTAKQKRVDLDQCTIEG